MVREIRPRARIPAPLGQGHRVVGVAVIGSITGAAPSSVRRERRSGAGLAQLRGPDGIRYPREGVDPALAVVLSKSLNQTAAADRAVESTPAASGGGTDLEAPTAGSPPDRRGEGSLHAPGIGLPLGEKGRREWIGKRAGVVEEQFIDRAIGLDRLGRRLA